MVKEVKDYVDTVQERWPWLTKSEVNKILTYGLKRYAWVNKMHADVLLCTREENDPMVIHCGPLGKDKLKAFGEYLSECCEYRLAHGDPIQKLNLGSIGKGW